MSRFLRPVGPHISASILDGELVAIDLASGSYYHAGSVGAQIWQLAVAQVDVQDIGNQLEQRYPTVDHVVDQVTAFLNQLTDNGLLAAHETPGPVDEGAAQRDESPGGSGAYEAPSLSRFDDMQQLLLLDPIHDVDQSGWPVSDTDGETADTPADTTNRAAEGSAKTS